MRKYIDYLNGVLVLFMFLTIFIQIAARVVVKVPTSWSVEMGILLFVFVVFFGITTLTRERGHLNVDTLMNILPAGFRRIVGIGASVLIILFFVVFSVGAIRNVSSNWTVEIPTIEWFKWGYVYLIMLFAVCVNVAYLVLNLIEDIQEARKK